MAAIIVRTNDFRLAFKLIKELRKRNTTFKLIDFDEELPKGDLVWLGTEQEIVEEFQKSGDSRGIACSIDDLSVAVDSAIHKSKGIESIETLAFGVDPGPRPGLAWLADSRLIGMAQLEQPNQVINHILGIASRLPHKRMVVRIGDGSPSIRDRLLNECLKEHFLCEEVNENKTSQGFSRHDHSRSAVKIAMNSGTRVFEIRELNVSEGEIRNLKQKSRRYSQGRITISSSLARSVATGKYTLEEAIAIHLSDEKSK